jgi:hypothetical protein
MFCVCVCARARVHEYRTFKSARGLFRYSVRLVSICFSFRGFKIDYGRQVTW